jgi:hypothetical protein
MEADSNVNKSCTFFEGLLKVKVNEAQCKEDMLGGRGGGIGIFIFPIQFHACVCCITIFIAYFLVFSLRISLVSGD